MKKVLLLSPTSRERTQLPPIATSLGCELLFDDFDCDYVDNFLGQNPDYSVPELDIVALTEETAAKYMNAGLAGVTSAIGYPGMSAASIIAAKLNLPGVSPEAVMCCEHKYYSRLAQQKFVPEATPAFQLISQGSTVNSALSFIEFPAFLKPVKSCMSKNAYRVHDANQLGKLAQDALMPRQFVQPFNDLIGRYSDFAINASGLLLEGLLKGHQVSLEGCVYDGHVKVLGIIDAVMFPGTHSFEKFVYPSQLPKSVQLRMQDIASRFFRGIAYNNAMFNMELLYDEATDKIGIIEVNPKIASQFPSLFEKVDGYSSYRTLLELAIGESPTILKQKGEFKIAASCVLRIFADQKVIAVPTEAEKAAVKQLFPEARIQIFAKPGKKLSDEPQDAGSFRYGLIDLGADSLEQLQAKFERCQSMLTFQFAALNENAPQLLLV